MSSPLDILDQVVGEPCTEPLKLEGVEGLNVRLFPNDIYKALTELERQHPDDFVKVTFWWIIAVGVVDAAGITVFLDKIDTLTDDFVQRIPTLEQANLLEQFYGHPKGRRVMNDIWEAVMSFNGYITAKDGAEGKK